MMMIDLVWFPTPRWLRARDTSPTQQCFRHVVLDASARRIGSAGRKMIYLFFPLPCWQLCIRGPANTHLGLLALTVQQGQTLHLQSLFLRALLNFLHYHKDSFNFLQFFMVIWICLHFTWTFQTESESINCGQCHQRVVAGDLD